jgi:hypothetical protein
VRVTSGFAGQFPFGSKLVPFIMIKGGETISANDRRGKLDMLAQRGGKILAVWPGQWSSDAFVVDDRKAALRVLESRWDCLNELDGAMHRDGKHHPKASATCPACQEHLTGKHAERLFSPDYCTNMRCPTRS